MTEVQQQQTSVFQQTAQQQIAEWSGHSSSKFNGSRKHVPEPDFKEVAHPLYSTYGKRHYEKPLSDSYQWKPTIRVDHNKDQQRPDKAFGTKKIDIQYAGVKPRPERKHVEPNPSGSYEDMQVGKATFMDVHNRKSVNEYKQESCMGSKKRVETVYDARNGLPLKSLGDKIYKMPDYQPGFYKEGGLVVGSTHQKKIKSGGNAKAIDFYAGIQLGKGPLNPNRKLWKDAVKEEQLNDELGAVTNLKNWERNVLKEVDPKYQVSDDSDDDKKKK